MMDGLSENKKENIKLWLPSKVTFICKRTLLKKIDKRCVLCKTLIFIIIRCTNSY